MTACPLCHAVTAVARHSFELARYLHHGVPAEELKILVDDLADSHRLAIQLSQMSTSEQLDQMGVVHPNTEWMPS